MADSTIRLMPGPSGWVQARFNMQNKLSRVFVRFEPDAKGRWHAVEWSLPGYPPDELRRIPFHRIALAVAADEQVTDKLAARFEEEAELGFRNAYGEAQRRAPLILRRPPGRRLDDSFYQQVGLVYRQAIGRGHKPRQAIASAAGVSADVAGRWIYEARKRGLIPKTKPGKVTA
jgi:hypothetical protein